ncbi:RRXRR domain-containing protein [Halomonas sp. BBD45]|uniref:RRXRR domain-containing protein n=1 Tax=Halomonas sp. BBD45 TaxID=1904451 RepID=UPI0034615C97
MPDSAPSAQHEPALSAAAFNNPTRPEGWLAPRLQHRLDTVMSWVTRLCKLASITEISQELVYFTCSRCRILRSEGSSIR